MLRLHITDCSCRPDCVTSSSCCFSSPEVISPGVKRECLYPAVSQEFGAQLRGKTDIFNTVVDVTNCTSDYIIVNQTYTNNTTSKMCKSTKSTYLCSGGKGDPCDTCNLNDTKCGECYCQMHKKEENGIEILVLESCVCDNPILQEENCSCGDVKVAPWGTMLPVYSREKKSLYKNPVCAACNGVIDGIVWIPVIYCNMRKFQNFDFTLDEGCSVNFVEPKSIETSLLPRCTLKNTFCVERFPVPHGLNMTSEQIIEACESEFYSMYDHREKNVFCAVCNDKYLQSSNCVGDSDLKWGIGKITFLMTLDFLIEKTTKPRNRRPRQIRKACSKSVRIIL